MAQFQLSVSKGLYLDNNSDSGTNFVGDDNELRKEFEALGKNRQLLTALAQNGNTWHFIPHSAPHFGGLWEAGVKRIKHHLRKEIQNYTSTFEELITLLCKIEACSNFRPLNANIMDNEDWSYLTPGHFLTGSATFLNKEI